MYTYASVLMLQYRKLTERHFLQVFYGLAVKLYTSKNYIHLN